MEAHTSERLRKLLAQPGGAQFVREAIIKSVTSPGLKPIQIENKYDGRSYEFEMVPVHPTKE